jgi:hypothetical protein
VIAGRRRRILTGESIVRADQARDPGNDRA